MRKFRKKPVVIEAFQITRERRIDKSEWPEWLKQAWRKPIDEPGAVFCSLDECPRDEGTTTLLIQTLEGTHQITWGDWIIRDVQGELYPCKPDIFRATYEEVEIYGDD